MIRLAIPAVLLLSLLVGCGRSTAPSAPVDPPAASPAETVEPVADRDASSLCNISFTSAMLPDSYQYSLVTPSANILGNVASYSWSFGGGAFPNTSTLASPMVKLTGYGNYSGSLTIYDTCGFPRTRTFNYIVYPYLYGAYAVTAPNPSTLGPPVYGGDMVNVGSTMGIASYDIAGGNLRYSTGASQIPSSGNWNSNHLVDGTGDTGRQPSIVLANGAIKIAYFDYTNQSIRLAQATVPNPTTSAHWHLQTIDALTPTVNGSGPGPCLAWSNDGLVLSYHLQNNQLRVVTTLSGQTPLFPTGPTSWINLGSPHNIFLDGEMDSDHTVMLVNDRVYLSYTPGFYDTNEARMKFATYRPSADPGWQLHDIAPTLQISHSTTSAMTLAPNGNPVVAFYANTTDSLCYARATVAVPTSASDWVSHTAVSNFGHIRIMDLVFNEGRPCVSFYGQDPDAARRAAVWQGAYSGNFVYIAQGLSTGPAGRKDWSLVPVGSGASIDWSAIFNGGLSTAYPTAPMLTFPATGIDRLAVLYDQPNGALQTYAASYVPNPPPFQ